MPNSANNPAPQPDEAAVALCIYGEDLEPSEVTRLLSGEPTHAHRRGDLSRGNVAYDKGAWIREVRQPEPIDPDAMVARVFSQLTHDPSVWERIAARFRVQLDFSVHTDQGCRLVLSAESMRVLAARHVVFALDIYAYGASA